MLKTTTGGTHSCLRELPPGHCHPMPMSVAVVLLGFSLLSKEEKIKLGRGHIERDSWRVGGKMGHRCDHVSLYMYMYVLKRETYVHFKGSNHEFQFYI